jgi:hypothetical protein
MIERVCHVDGSWSYRISSEKSSKNFSRRCRGESFLLFEEGEWRSGDDEPSLGAEVRGSIGLVGTLDDGVKRRRKNGEKLLASAPPPRVCFAS